MESQRNHFSAARDSLDLVAQARAAAAGRLAAPGWYHPILAVLTGVFVAAYPIASLDVQAVILGCYVVGLVLLTAAYRRRTGMWVSGLRRGRTRPYAVLTLIFVVVCAAVPMIVNNATGLIWPSVLGGLLAAAAVLAFGRVFDRLTQAGLLNAA